MLSPVSCQLLMFVCENRFRATGLVSCNERAIPGIISYEKVGFCARRVSNMRWRQKAGVRFTKERIRPYTGFLMSDGIAQIGHELSNCRAHRPLLIVVDSLEHVDFIGRHSYRQV